MTRYRGIKRLGKNKYRVRARRIDPRTGKEKEVRRTIQATLREALVFQLELRDEVVAAHEAAPRMTLTDYVKSWLAIKVTQIKPSTATKYVNDLENHILPALGDIYVDRLRPSDVAKFVAGQSHDHAGWSVTNRLRLLRQISKDALAEGLSERDFCARIKPPACSDYTEDEPNLLSAKELDKLIGAIPEPWRPLIVTMAFTGMRWGEASGLKWEDIDEDAQMISVRRTNWKGTPVEPKTRKSRRKVPANPEVLMALRNHRRALVKDQHAGLTSGWVFPSQFGELHKGTPLRRVLNRALKVAEIDKRLTAHGLRRTFNDLVRRVASRVVVKSITGHATDQMMEHYSMVDAEEKKAASLGVLRLVKGPGTETGHQTGQAPSGNSGPEGN